MPCLFAQRWTSRRALAHLADVARGRVKIVRVHRLDGVDHQRLQTWVQRVGLCQDGVDIRLREQVERVALDAQPLGAHLDLLGRFLAGDVEHGRLLRCPARPRPAAAASTCRCRAPRRSARSIPGTRPPPSTRDTSTIGTGMRGYSPMEIWLSGLGGCEPRGSKAMPPLCRGLGPRSASRPGCPTRRSWGTCPCAGQSSSCIRGRPSGSLVWPSSDPPQ